MTSSTPSYSDPHPGLRGSDRVSETCGRCGGSGLYVGPTNAKWENGSGSGSRPYCFQCGGAGVQRVLVSSVRARVRREVAARAEQERRDAETVAARAAWEAAGYAALLAEAETAREGLRTGDPLGRALGYAIDALNSYRATEAQADAVRHALAAIADAEVEKGEVVEGRREIVGTVLQTKLQESPFGSAWKMLVDEGTTRLWGTIPASIDPERGDRVRLTATVQRSADDRSFGFYSRPARAEVIA